jgi:hypothetical protein
MMKLFDSLFQKITTHGRGLLTIGKTVTEAKMLTAKLLVDRLAERGLIADIQQAEFKVFSQFGEDGIIQYLVQRAKVLPAEKSLVEFGADFYGEANTRFLVLNDNWRALLIDGKPSSIRAIQRQPFFWSHDITAVASFITAENIDEIIGGAGYRGTIGLLSIDIDGNDYWVWDKISVVDPVIVVAEYNSLFGSKRAVTIPYDPKFYRMNAHHSGLYFGCSLKALEILAARKGYALVGCNSNANNCFFVKTERLNGQPVLTTEQAYVESRFRELRDASGKFTYQSGHRAQLEAIGDMPLVDIESQTNIRVRDLIG